MTLKAVVENLDSVEESHRSLYVQDGGKYRLNVEGAVSETEIGGLKSALQKERERAKQLEKLAKAAEGIDLEEYQTLKTEAESRAQKDAEKKGEWDKLRAQMLEKHQTELKTREEKVGLMRTALESYLVDAGATQELAAAKGVPGLLLPHVKSQVKVIEEDGSFQVRVVNAKGEPRVNGDGQFMTIKDLVSEMRQSEIYARAFEGSGASGSGTPPSGSGRSGQSSKPRSQMSIDEKSAYIRDHGQDAYLKLPF